MYKKSKGDTFFIFQQELKKGLATAALETAGITKANVNRLIFMPQHEIQIWGKAFISRWMLLEPLI